MNLYMMCIDMLSYEYIYTHSIYIGTKIVYYLIILVYNMYRRDPI